MREDIGSVLRHKETRHCFLFAIHRNSSLLIGTYLRDGYFFITNENKKNRINT